MGRISDWVRHHKWWVALIFVAIAGYSIGKERALRDNMRSASLSAEAV